MCPVPGCLYLRHESARAEWLANHVRLDTFRQRYRDSDCSLLPLAFEQRHSSLFQDLARMRVHGPHNKGRARQAAFTLLVVLRPPPYPHHRVPNKRKGCPSEPSSSSKPTYINVASFRSLRLFGRHSIHPAQTHQGHHRRHRTRINYFSYDQDEQKQGVW